MKPVRAPSAQHSRTAERVRPPSAAPSLRRSTVTFAAAGNRAFGRLLQTGFRATQPNDAHEREAQGLATNAVSTVGTSGAPPAGAVLPVAPRSTEEARLTSNGDALAPSVRVYYEARFGLDLGAVRVHTGSNAEAQAAAFGARAFAYGNHIWLGRGQNATPSPTLAHELAHVHQYATTGALVVAREADADPDAAVSLGALDSYLADKIGSEVLGPTHWAIMREFLRGVVGGLKSAPPDQVARIRAKFKSQSLSDQWEYGKGYGLGILEGLWAGLTGLFDAVVTLVKLPYDINQYLIENVPALAKKYGPRIADFLTEGGGIQQRIKNVLRAIWKDPKAALKQFDAAVEGIKQGALVQVRAFGHGAANRISALLEKKWFEYGREIGKIVGQVLFEVILALASDAIANVVKSILSVAARLLARTAEAALELFSFLRRLVGEALASLAKVARSFTGQMSELFEGLRALLGKLGTLLDELVPEMAVEANTGARVPVPPKGAPVLESRAVKPPVRTASATTADLTPPKVHPSKVAEEARAAQEAARLAKIQRIGGELPLNAKDFAGKTFHFDLAKNPVARARLAEKYEGAELASRLKEFDRLAKEYPKGVKFTPEGFPDFKPYAQKLPNGEFSTKVLTKGSRSADFAKADAQTGVTEAYRMRNRLTWHHVEDRKLCCSYRTTCTTESSIRVAFLCSSGQSSQSRV